MLKSCFGFPLRTGTNIIAISNAILSFCYIVYNIWQHYVFRNQLITHHDEIMKSLDKDAYSKEYRLHRDYYDFHHYFSDKSQADVMINAVTSIFLLAGSTMFFANIELKFATAKNATQKIYLWLMVNYVQFSAIIIMEIIVLMRDVTEVNSFILFGYFICFVLIDAILTYQTLVVYSFYAEEKSVEQFNYNQLTSKLPPSQIEDDNEKTEELQHVELDC